MWYSIVVYVLLEIGLLSKRVHISGFLSVILFIWCPLMPSPPGLALLYLALRRGLLENLKGFWNQTSGETRIQKEKKCIRRGQRKKKILKLKWGNSTNYRLSQSNPVTIAKNMKRCKHGNKLLIWMYLTCRGSVQLRYTAANPVSDPQ